MRYLVKLHRPTWYGTRLVSTSAVASWASALFWVTGWQWYVDQGYTVTVEPDR